MTQDDWAKPTPAEYAMGYAEGFNDACKPKQGEPVAWLEPEWGEAICPEVGYEIKMTDDHPRDLDWTPLYAHPPHTPIYAQRTWVRLTDKEIEECWDGDLSPYQMQCIREIEAKLKEKNNA
jgi:hypothetical protein